MRWEARFVPKPGTEDDNLDTGTTEHSSTLTTRPSESTTITGMNPNTTTPYQKIGGEPTVRRLVQRFYELMDTRPEAAGIRAMHPPELSGSADKLYMFLSGWFGGPELYVEKFGPPFMRARHLPFSIGVAERDQWLACMKTALEECVDDAELRKQLYVSFAALANHMRNQAEPQDGKGALPVIQNP